MSSAVVNVSTNLKPELLTDVNGTPVTTKVNGDWTKTAVLLGTATFVTPTITHRASGKYDIVFTPTAVGNWSVEYSVVVDGETMYFDPQLVQVETAAQADPMSAFVAAISGANITVASPVAIGGLITIYQGDDYDSDEGRALAWNLSGGPSLVGAVVTLLVLQAGTDLSVVCVVTNAGQPTQTIAVELTNAQTATLTANQLSYDVSAVLANGHKQTLIRGTIQVIADMIAG